jgi:hypothetical protein
VNQSLFFTSLSTQVIQALVEVRGYSLTTSLFVIARIIGQLDIRHIVKTRTPEPTIAVANDVEVPEVEVGRELGISHILIMK